MINVLEGEEKQRLDSFLAKKCPEYTRTMLQRLIADGNVLPPDFRTKSASSRRIPGFVFCFRHNKKPPPYIIKWAAAS